MISILLFFITRFVLRGARGESASIVIRCPEPVCVAFRVISNVL